MLDKLTLYFQYPFVRYALIVGVLIAFCSSLLGVTLVLKRFSFIGDGLSHVAFGAMAVATVLNLSNDMWLMMPVTILSAILLLRTGQNTEIKGDALVAMIQKASVPTTRRITATTRIRPKISCHFVLTDARS